MGVPEEVAISKLNKIQASELLDVLFNDEENRALLNPDEVLAHYKTILGVNEGVFGKLPIIMEKTENRLKRIVENVVRRALMEGDAYDAYQKDRLNKWGD